MSADKFDQVLSRLEAVATRLEKVGFSKGGASPDSDAEFLEPFEKIMKEHVAAFVAKSKQVSEEVYECAQLLEGAFAQSLSILKVAAVSRMPTQAQLPTVLKPLSDKLTEIQDYMYKSRGKKEFNHIESITNVSTALGWIQMPIKPANYIKEMIDSGKFYTNRVLKDFKEKGAVHSEWVSLLLKCFSELQEYVCEWHATGCTWNPSGKEAAAPAPTASAPQKVSGGDGAKKTAALFSDISKGAAITSGLKKVDDSQKTHKNPELKAAGPIQSTAKKSIPAFTPKPAAAKTPEFELIGSKWSIAHQKNVPILEITEGDITNTLYMYNCQNTGVKITPKIKSIAIESCQGCQIQLDSGIISSLDVINCKKTSLYCNKLVPSLVVSNSDSCQIFFQPESVDCKVITSKSSGVNICVYSDGGDFTEYPLPEQFVNTLSNGKVITEPAENC